MSVRSGTALRAALYLAQAIVALDDLEATGRLTDNNLEVTTQQMLENLHVISAFIAGIEAARKG